jgi:mRNA-degrading endonuclease toxin of MazEF toxin-antitoxin module
MTVVITVTLAQRSGVNSPSRLIEMVRQNATTMSSTTMRDSDRTFIASTTGMTYVLSGHHSSNATPATIISSEEQTNATNHVVSVSAIARRADLPPRRNARESGLRDTRMVREGLATAESVANIAVTRVGTSRGVGGP